MDIYLIRHGECYESTEDHFDTTLGTMNPPLTDRGVRQAHLLAERLTAVEFDVLYASDLRRATETMEIANREIHAKVVVTKSFREIDMGEIYTKSWSEFPELHQQWRLHEEDIRYPSGENGNDVWERCKHEMEYIVQYHDRRVAIFCHGGTIRSIICGMLGIPQQKRFSFGQPLQNCSISVIRKNEDRLFLHSLNDYRHLDG